MHISGKAGQTIGRAGGTRPQIAFLILKGVPAYGTQPNEQNKTQNCNTRKASQKSTQSTTQKTTNSTTDCGCGCGTKGKDDGSKKK